MFRFMIRDNYSYYSHRFHAPKRAHRLFDLIWDRTLGYGRIFVVVFLDRSYSLRTPVIQWCIVYEVRITRALGHGRSERLDDRILRYDECGRNSICDRSHVLRDQCTLSEQYLAHGRYVCYLGIEFIGNHPRIRDAHRGQLRSESQ